MDKLRLADVELAKGTSIAAVCKLLSVSEQTYYHWRKEYGGLKVDQAKSGAVQGTAARERASQATAC